MLLGENWCWSFLGQVILVSVLRVSLHIQFLKKALGKLPGPGSQPPAETELRKRNGTFCSSRMESKKWNTLEGRPFVPENFRSNRAFHLRLHWSNRKFCLPYCYLIWPFWGESVSRGFIFTILIRKYEKKAFYFAILAFSTSFDF